MVDDRPEDNGPAPDSGRAKRAPPTIDLEPSEVTSETQNSGSHVPPEQVPPEHAPEPPAAATSPSPSPSPWVVAVISGAVAASLVIGVGWMLGWPEVPPNGAAPQVNAATIDGLAARVTSIEAKTDKPPSVSDPAAAVRVEALEKSLAALRGDLATARAQSEKLVAEINNLKSTPRESASPDLTAINERIAGIERARVQADASAQESAEANKPADDVPLRRVVVASMLDVSVRQGDPYPSALAAAKSLAANSDALKPLDGFAASGVPSAAVLSRELLTLVPKLSPPARENAVAGSGIVDRLQAGASKLVRIERTDAAGSDRGAVIARVTAAALRNDVAEARRELNTLAPADRAAAQAWLDKSDARDAALAASRQFAADAMAALAKPAQ